MVECHSFYIDMGDFGQKCESCGYKQSWDEWPQPHPKRVRITARTWKAAAKWHRRQEIIASSIIDLNVLATERPQNVKKIECLCRKLRKTAG